MLSAEQIRKFLDTADEDLVVQLLAMGATAEDLAEADACLKCDEADLRELGRLPTGRAAEVLAILKTQSSRPRP